MKNYHLDHCGMKLLVDNPELTTLQSGHVIAGNSFERVFAPWPLRFYVVTNSKIVSAVTSFWSHISFFLSSVELDI
jgi:hypothetical protein